ncbi:MAG: putative endoribonuclease [Rhodospirillales bacterium]|jgi:2-iminobutanoate/2-iminopropanoate deaminase|nr:putative endoribonuclease [Rhodospirillales bacterium]
MRIRILAIAAAVLAVAGTAAGAQGLTREVVTPPGATGPAPPFSPAVKVGNTIYLAGQVGGDAGPEFRDQVAAALKKVQVLVEAAGSTLANVDRCTVFLTRQSDFAAMNEVWRGVFADKPPARSTIVVAALAAPALLVEVECLAHL